MINKFKHSRAIRQNYRELLFVFAAFALMVLAGYFFTGRMIRTHLLNGASEMIYSAGANVKAGLTEAETTLNNSYYIVQEMIEHNASKEDILDFLTTTTEWMQRRDQGLLGFYGIYGYINGELYDSIGIDPQSNYIPQRRPWYRAAVRGGDTIAYTAPYQKANIGEFVVSAVRNLSDKNGNTVGMLVIDIDISWLQEYVTSLSLAPGGYGVLISQTMTIMAHPNDAFMGKRLQELGDAQAEMARVLREEGEVSGRRMLGTSGKTVIAFFTRLDNGWYVGNVTPYFEFYRDLYLSGAILILMGIVLSIALCLILMRLAEARMRADEDSKSKSSFLANMSHEIRTPMNAITGMAELMLRGDLSDEARSYANDIKHAGSNLLSIINDLLDFSKIEAGKLEIIPVEYMLASLVNDVVNIIRMRLIEKPVHFFTNIDSNIPECLFGDEVRMRQIVLNLLSNAAKYTQSGHLSFCITAEKQTDKQVWLRITVTDTGKGIKPEDQVKLFSDFMQVDTKKNRDIEGTGLGLAITKRLCNLMGGNISFFSEYGTGSEFAVIIPQQIISAEPFTAVENATAKKVLVYEDRAVYAKSVGWSLDNMGVPYTVTEKLEDFAAALLREEWSFVFAGYDLYEEIKSLMNQGDNMFPGGKKPFLALLVEWGTEAHIPNTRFVSLPVQSLSIANVLNGKADAKGYAEHSAFSGAIRYTIPHARLLVVDDISTNLKVAEGLLSPYRATVDTCLNGSRAIALVQEREYDLVFMDHMMPEMDGIEATAIIRALDGERFKTMPIVALTANAVVGMKEMFISKGFNDFLAKPIDVSKLDEIIDKWVPDHCMQQHVAEQEQHGKSPNNSHSNDNSELALASSAGDKGDTSSLPNIPGVDVEKGIAMTGGTVAAYKQVLPLFLADAKERLPLLQHTPEVTALPTFVTQVHALKSATASLGAAEVSAAAAQLEAAGKAGDIASIAKALPAFAQQLSKLIDNISAALEADAAATQNESQAVNVSAHIPALQKLAEALQAKKAAAVDRILEELNQQPLDSATRKKLEQIADEVLMTEFDKALEVVRELKH